MAAASRTWRATRPCLTLPATGTDGLATQNIVIDTTPPAVSGVSDDGGREFAYEAGGTIPITVTFSETVNVTGTPQLTLNDGGGSQLRQRQRHLDAHVQLHRGGGQNTADLDYASTAALHSMVASSRTRRAMRPC